MLRSVFALILALVCAGPSCLAQEAPQPGQRIDDDGRLRTMLSGNTLTGIIPGFPDTWAEYYCPNGISIYTYGDAIYDGRWKISDGKACFAYDPPDYDRPYCLSVFLQSDGRLIIHSDEAMDGFVQTSIANPPLAGDPLDLRRKFPRGCEPKGQPSV